ncbi:MAG: hypothetical protein EXQ87_07210 [Alphaproteobacteria bacterium]|nr:hypothetical protein [Alphaproteobacteria bacterium]
MEKDELSGPPAASVEKIRNIVSYLQDMANPGELRHIPNWKAHQLTGVRKGTWSLAVTRLLVARNKPAPIGYSDYRNYDGARKKISNFLVFYALLTTYWFFFGFPMGRMLRKRKFLGRPRERGRAVHGRTFPSRDIIRSR